MRAFKTFLIRVLLALKKREFLFITLVYPSMFFLAKWLLSVLKSPAKEHRIYFGPISFAVFALIIIISIAEIIQRKFKHELQGEKLKLREKEGVSLLNKK